VRLTYILYDKVFVFGLFFCFVFVFGFVLFGGVWGLVGKEVFIARVVTDGKVTVPKRVRDLLDICEGDYVRLSLLEVIKKKESREDAGKRKAAGG